MDLCIQQGKVLYVGSSNFAGWHIAQAQEHARHCGRLGLVSEQSVYSLLNRTIELEVMPACEAYGLGLLTYSPLAAGALADKLAEGERGRRFFLPERSFDDYHALCKDIGHAPADVALAWVAHQPGITAPIVGPRTIEQFEGNLGALDIDLEEETLERLDELFPGPGGRAPEAYAW